MTQILGVPSMFSLGGWSLVQSAHWGRRRVYILFLISQLWLNGVDTKM